MYVLLIALLLLLFLNIIPVFKFELLYPPVIFTLMFLFCTSVGLIRYNDWRLYEYSSDTVCLIMLGVCSFVIMGFVARLFERNIPKCLSGYRRERLEISRLYVAFFIILGIVGNLLFFFYIKRVVVALGYDSSSLSRLLNSYYNIKVALKNTGEYGIPRIVTVLNYIVNVNALLALYVLLHNFCFKVAKKEDFWLLILVGLWPVQLLLNSARGNILILLAETVYLLYFFWNTYYGWNKKTQKKILKWGIIFFASFLALFLVLTVFLGRRSSFEELDIIDYLTIYISGGIRNFDLFLKEPVLSSDFGRESFPAVHRFLYNHFGIGELYSLGLEFRAIDGKNIGNIYTAFRRFYADFGTLGIVILSGFLGYFFSFLYVKIKEKCYKNKFDFTIILFCCISKEIFYMAIEDTLFISELSFNGLFRLIMMYILYYIFIKRKAKFKVTRCIYLRAAQHL